MPHIEINVKLWIEKFFNDLQHLLIKIVQIFIKFSSFEDCASENFECANFVVFNTYYNFTNTFT